MTYVDNMNSFFRVNISQFFIEKEHYGNLWNRVKISFQQTKVKGITTPSVKRQASSGSFEVLTLAMMLGNGSGTHFGASQCIPMGHCRLTLRLPLGVAIAQELNKNIIWIDPSHCLVNA